MDSYMEFILNVALTATVVGFVIMTIKLIKDE